MFFLQTHLPKEKDATSEQEWGWNFNDFISDNFWYLIGLGVVIAIFLFARYSYRKNYMNNKKL